MFILPISLRKQLLRATMLAGVEIVAGGLGGGVAHATSPSGFYVVVDPESSDAPDVATGLPVSALYGSLACGPAGADGIALCNGGITGVHLSVEWNHFQQLHTVNHNSTVELDHDGNLTTVMNNIKGLESAGFSFQLDLGLKAGDNAAYDVLDLYVQMLGRPNGSDPAYSANGTVTPDEVENGCKFSYGSDGITVNRSGGTFGTTNMPEQCVLRTNGPTLACVSQPRIWGSDGASMAANGYYRQAHKQALQDLLSFVTGASGFNAPYPHHVKALKLAGISSHDEEIAIPGEVHLAQPPGGYYCGNAAAANNEQIWTSQTDAAGNPIFQTAVMETTWENLLTDSTSVTSTFPRDTLHYIIDVVAADMFPPVNPASCSTNCGYTPPADSRLTGLTTGEMEHLIDLAIDGSYLSMGNVSIQNQSLSATQPNYLDTVQSAYGTHEIPCAMNARHGTPIGYQIGGAGTFSTDTDKLAYLQSISNGAAYGAQYIELIPGDVANFVADHAPTTFEGASNYGTTDQQNRNMLSNTISAALSTLAANAANSSTGSLCHLPVITDPQGGTHTVPWTYPYPVD